MNKGQIALQKQLARVEPVKDPAVNKALFTIYSNLINPLVNIEKTIDEISYAEAVAAETEGKVKIPLPSIIAHIICMLPKMYIAIAITSFILAHFIDALDTSIETALLLCAKITVILSPVCSCAYDMISIASKNRTRKENHDRAVNDLARLKPDLERQVYQIKDAIQFVPPKYRFSGALSYFVESYTNSRVDDLKEAVNAYDTYYFRNQTVQIQQQILEQEQKNTMLLSQIAYNQLCMMGQLDGILGSVWLS